MFRDTNVHNHFGPHPSGITATQTGHSWLDLVGVLAAALVLGVLAFLIFRWWSKRYWYIDILQGLDDNDEKVIKAKDDATKKNTEILPALNYTEGDYRLTLIYDHVRSGQISPDKVSHMKRSDLEFIAGMKFPHPDLLEKENEKDKATAPGNNREQLTKLMGNVARAESELRRRSLYWTAAITAIAALLAASIGALAATVK